MEELVSIIVPAYNAERRIRECIMSILNQTYKHLEIIVIDDGSIDNTYSICQSLCSYDLRIKLYHKENEGVAIARNYGLRVASGKYIGFVDSDDEINVSMIQNMYDCIKLYDADVAVCSYKKTGNIFYKDINNKVKVKNILEYSGDSFQQQCYLNSEKYGFANWNKLYKADIVKQIEFGNYRIGEDRLFNAQVFFSVNKVVYVMTDNPMYYYYDNPASLTGSFDIDRFIECLLAQSKSIEFSKSKKTMLFGIEEYTLLAMLGQQYIIRHNETWPQCKDEIIKYRLNMSSIRKISPLNLITVFFYRPIRMMIENYISYFLPYFMFKIVNRKRCM